MEKGPVGCCFYNAVFFFVFLAYKNECKCIAMLNRISDIIKMG
jgi:hypothetical protein